MRFVIELAKKNRKDFWCVLAEVKFHNNFVFVKSFPKFTDAVKFIRACRAKIKEGDYSWLKLRT